MKNKDEKPISETEKDERIKELEKKLEESE